MTTNVEKTYVTGVRLRNSSKISLFMTNSLEFQVGANCIVNTDGGEEFATIVIAPRLFTAGKIKQKPFKSILRLADTNDLQRMKKNTELEKEALEVSSDKILEKKIPMKLIKVDFSFDAEKAVFYYSAEGRVDFRELIKELAHIFKIKIEMHQIGMREKAKMLGGCGSCGQVLCCTSYLKDFEPVSIRMAKDQNLALNPTKISGLCGRLMCCLIYENDFYVQQKKLMPKCGAMIDTPEGKGKVLQCDCLTEKVTVEINSEEGEGRKRVKLTLEELNNPVKEKEKEPIKDRKKDEEKIPEKFHKKEAEREKPKDAGQNQEKDRNKNKDRNRNRDRDRNRDRGRGRIENNKDKNKVKVERK